MDTAHHPGAGLAGIREPLPDSLPSSSLRSLRNLGLRDPKMRPRPAQITPPWVQSRSTAFGNVPRKPSGSSDSSPRSFLATAARRESASRTWEAAWEEEDDEEEVVSPEPVSAKAETWRIEQYVAVARDGKLNLAPSYQRGDVWSTSARQLLIESILRGIPLPSVILLKSSRPETRRYEVVDGKQR